MPPICIAVLALRSEEREILSVLLPFMSQYDPLCIAIRLPFVSQDFWENLGGGGGHRVGNPLVISVSVASLFRNGALENGLPLVSEIST